MSSLKKQKDILQDRIKQETKLSVANLPGLSRTILQIVGGRDQSTVSDLTTLSSANRNTIKKHLKALVDKRLIKKHGIKKGAWYSRV